MNQITDQHLRNATTSDLLDVIVRATVAAILVDVCRESGLQVPDMSEDDVAQVAGISERAKLILNARIPR